MYAPDKANTLPMIKLIDKVSPSKKNADIKLNIGCKYNTREAVTGPAVFII